MEEYRMLKEDLVVSISEKIDLAIDRTIYGNNTNEDKQNGTVTRIFLNAICDYEGIDHTKLNTKTDCAKEICKNLNIDYEEKYIGNNGQISNDFLRNIDKKIKK